MSSSSASEKNVIVKCSNKLFHLNFAQLYCMSPEDRKRAMLFYIAHYQPEKLPEVFKENLEKVQRPFNCVFNLKNFINLGIFSSIFLIAYKGKRVPILTPLVSLASIGGFMGSVDFLDQRNDINDALNNKAIDYALKHIKISNIDFFLTMKETQANLFIQNIKESNRTTVYPQ